MVHDQSKMESYYSARAGEYDKIYLKPERQDDLKQIRSWLIEKFANTSVLEIACGTGYWTQFIEGSAQRILSIDTSEEVLAIARERVPSASVDFIVDDAYELSGVNGNFNASFAGFWFSHVPIKNQQRFLKGLGSKLDDGATVVLLDNRYVQGSSTPVSHKDDEGNTYQTRLLENGSEHRVLKNFPSEDELHACVDGVGVSPVTTVWHYYWALEYISVKP